MFPQNLSLSDNQTSNWPAPEESPFVVPFLIAGKCVVCVIISCTILGDLLVYAAFSNNSSLRTSTNAFFLSLVTSDVLLAALVMPLDVVRLAYHPVWPLGVTTCNIWNSAFVALGTATSCNLCAVGIERYLAISRPLKHNNEISGGVTVSLVFLWMFAFMNGLGSYFIWEQFDPRVCAELSAPVKSSAPLLIVNILLPFGICILMYGKIYQISRRQAKRIMAARCSKGTRSFSRQKKSAKTLSLLVGMFFICFIPFFVFHLLDAVYRGLPNRFYAESVVKWLIYANSATNWAVYGFLNREFRETFIRIFHGLCGKVCRRHPRRNEVTVYVIP